MNNDIIMKIQGIGIKLFEFILNSNDYDKYNLILGRSKAKEIITITDKPLHDFGIHGDYKRFCLETDEARKASKDYPLNDFDEFNVIINNEEYSFYLNAKDNIYIKKTPSLKVSDLDIKYQAKPSGTPEEIKQTIIDMAQFIKFSEIADTTYTTSSDTYLTSILSTDLKDGIAHYNENFIKLCSFFNQIINESEINFLKEKHFVKTYISDNHLNCMFERWIKFLKRKKHTRKKEFEFNDLDNYAFFEENEKCIAMSQKNQNTLFVYIKDKETNRIKVFRYADQIEKNIDYIINEIMKSDNYLHGFKEFNSSYSFENYCWDIKSPLYPRFFEHYFENYETEGEYLIFDSDKGFNLNQHYIFSLNEDFKLLNDNMFFKKN